MDDWEREYEEDRRRMAAGIDTGNTRRRGADDDSDPFRERKPESSYVPPSMSEPGKSTSSSYGTATTAGAGGGGGYGTSSAAEVRGSSVPEARGGSKAEEDAKIEALYAQYRDDGPSSASGRGGSERDGGATSSYGYSDGGGRGGADGSSGAPPTVNLPATWAPMFSGKFGRQLYFCESVKMFYKGFFSPNEMPNICFVTARGMYLGDDKTGEIVLGRSLRTLKEVQVLGDQGIGVRGDKVVDWYMVMPSNRQQFVTVVQKLTQFVGGVVQVRTLSVDAEKSFKKEIRYVDRREATWVLEEDPRTGLPLVEVPEQHVVPYAPVVPKILHWFGGVFQIVKDWKGSTLNERRGCWLTATALFLSKPTGPQVDGRDIVRCIGIEFMEEVVEAGDAHLGIIPDKEGPPQPHLALQFDNNELRRSMVSAIGACYEYRKKSPLKVTKCVALDGRIKVEKEKDHKPHLFVMKTRADLYGLLRGKV